MTREELINAIDSPTVAALENVFNGPGVLGKSYSEEIVDILAPRLLGNAQAVPAPVAWRLTDGEGDYEYLTEEPSDQSRAWSRRYGREWEPLYASPVSSTHHGDAT